MNTLLSPDLLTVPSRPEQHIHWMLQQAGTGTWFASTDEGVSWPRLSDMTELDPGFWIWQTQEAMEVLLLGLQGSEMVYSLQAPHPTRYFRFDRYAQRLLSQFVTEEEHVKLSFEPTWIYSVFGYVLGDQVVCVRYRPTKEMDLLVLTRPVHFPW